MANRRTRKICQVNKQMEYETLNQSSFDTLCSKLFANVEMTEEKRVNFRETIFAIQSELKRRLSQLWTEHADFEVAFDYSYCLCLAGAIYSDRIFCRKYVLIVSDVLSSFHGSSDWAYHTSHEDVSTPENDRGEFVVTGAKCVMTESMNAKWRMRLSEDA